jgi:hypothetical protein
MRLLVQILLADANRVDPEHGCVLWVSQMVKTVDQIRCNLQFLIMNFDRFRDSRVAPNVRCASILLLRDIVEVPNVKFAAKLFVIRSG